MSGQTPRFGFNFYGGDTDGSLEDDADKFTGEDRISLDTILAAFEKHEHHLTTTLTGPTAVPVLAYVTSSGGSLEAGTTYFYVISFLDGDGLETVTGPEASIVMPDILPTPDAPQGDTDTVTGAQLSAGLYYYGVTALRGSEESALGDLSLVTVLTGENAVHVTMPAYTGADTLQLWRMKDTDSSWTRITTGTGVLLDDGTISAAAYGDPANIPPSVATGADDYSVTIAVSGADVSAVQDAAGWRIYRTDVSGQYSSASLVHEAIERTDDLDPTSDLLTSYVDDGDAPLTGSPQLLSTQLQIPPFTFEQADPLPSPAGYPANYPILDGDGVLYIKTGSAWVAISGSGPSTGGTQIKGHWDSDVSEDPGYDPGDVVADNGHLWQALTPSADQQPTDVAVSTSPWGVIESTATYATHVGTQYAQGILAGGAHTLTGIDWWNTAVSSLPFDLQVWDGDPATATLLGAVTIADPSALSVGWNTATLPAAVTIAASSTHVITTTSSGNGVYDNVGTTATPSITGDVSTFGGLSYGPGYTSTSANYLALRLYESITGPWSDLGRFIPTGAGALYSGAGAPLPEPAGCIAGDLYIDTVTGDVYSLDGN